MYVYIPNMIICFLTKALALQRLSSYRHQTKHLRIKSANSTAVMLFCIKQDYSIKEVGYFSEL